MPVFHYRCGFCTNIFEVFEAVDARADRECPMCGTPSSRLHREQPRRQHRPQNGGPDQRRKKGPLAEVNGNRRHTLSAFPR